MKQHNRIGAYKSEDVCILNTKRPCLLLKSQNKIRLKEYKLKVARREVEGCKHYNRWQIFQEKIRFITSLSW